MNKLVNNKTLYSILLIAAIALLAFSAVKTSRAALTYVSDNYIAQVDTKSVGVEILENGNSAKGILLTDLVPKSSNPEPGTKYSETLSVKNTGTIDSFDRVIVRKYWVDENGKRVDLSPDFIKLELGEGWISDDSAATGEMCVLYYPNKLAPGEVSSPFVTSLMLDNSLRLMVSSERIETEDGWYESVVFSYNGASFVLEAEANAVQTHNAETAIKSAWGIDVAVSGDTYILK